MTEQEIIETLATKVMGWEKGRGMVSAVMQKKDIESKYYWYKDGERTAPCMTEQFMGLYAWNPLKDWNNWRQVEQKIMEDESLFKRFLIEIPSAECNWKLRRDDALLWIYMKSDLLTRCKVIVSILEPELCSCGKPTTNDYGTCSPQCS